MASVTYDKYYLWQRYYGKFNYCKSSMANETEPPVSKYFINFFLFTENKLGTETEEVAV